MSRSGSHRPECGLVSVETAFAVLFLALAAGLAIAVAGALFILGQCQVTANEVARQAARGDSAAIAQAMRDAPPGAVITRRAEANTVVVEVRVDASVGPLRWPMVAQARVLAER